MRTFAILGRRGLYKGEINERELKLHYNTQACTGALARGWAGDSSLENKLVGQSVAKQLLRVHKNGRRRQVLVNRF